MHVHNAVNVYMLTYCFTYVVLKLYVHHDNNIRLIYHSDIEQRLLPNTAGKKELYGSHTCFYMKADQFRSVRGVFGMLRIS